MILLIILKFIQIIVPIIIKMSEIKKLSIHSTLWEDPIEIIGINDVILNKLNVKGE